MADSLEFRFTIHGKLAGANELKSAERSHWSVGAKLRKKDLKTCKDAIWILGCLPRHYFNDAVGVSFAWFEPNAKRDPDNIISGQKAILDALVSFAIIRGDSQRYIKRLTHFIDIDRDNPRIEVTVYGIVARSSVEAPYRGVPRQGPDHPASQAL